MILQPLDSHPGFPLLSETSARVERGRLQGAPSAVGFGFWVEAVNKNMGP